MLFTSPQCSHFTVPSGSTVVLLVRPQLLQFQFLKGESIDTRFLAEGRRRARTALVGVDRRRESENSILSPPSGGHRPYGVQDGSRPIRLAARNGPGSAMRARAAST